LSVGVAAESFPGELRVALTPANVKLLKSKGFREVLVESGCGFKAQFLDEDYKAAGATVTTRDSVFSTSDILFKVRPPSLEGGIVNSKHEIDLLRDGSTLISFLYPAQNKDTVDALQKKVRTLCT
jgi:NAD(P) transhydrogenase